MRGVPLTGFLIIVGVLWTTYVVWVIVNEIRREFRSDNRDRPAGP